jgi:hypothetical protein
MNLRDALIQQSPSLALQRAAADEIAKLDARILELESIRIQRNFEGNTYSIPIYSQDRFEKDVNRNLCQEISDDTFELIWGIYRV